MRKIREVRVYTTDLTAGQILQGATVFAPRTLVPQADERLRLNGALIDHCSRHPIYSEWVPKMDDDEWKQFLTSQFSLDDHDIGVNQGSTSSTQYTLIVVMDKENRQ